MTNIALDKKFMARVQKSPRKGGWTYVEVSRRLA
jgi:hypothetical protein